MTMDEVPAESLGDEVVEEGGNTGQTDRVRDEDNVKRCVTTSVKKASVSARKFPLELLSQVCCLLDIDHNHTQGDVAGRWKGNILGRSEVRGD